MSPLLGAAVVTTAENKNEENKPSYVMKPSSLPLYTPLHEQFKESKTPQKVDHDFDTTTTGVTGSIESGIRSVRIQVQNVCHTLDSQKQQVQSFVNDGKQKTKFVVDYLNEPSNSLPRVGAIALGSAAGFIIGLRHGAIRRILYTGIGGTAIASVCYPQTAEMYAQHGIAEAKKLATIGYNFAYGIKPGDEGNQPKIPSTFTEVTGSITSSISAVYNTIFSDKKEK